MIIIILSLYIILQLVLPTNLFLFNIRPDLLLVLTLFMGLFNLRGGLLFSASFGLIKDIFSLGPFGLNIFSFSLWVIVARALSRQIYRDNKFIYLLLVVAATWGNYLIYLLVNNFLSKNSLTFSGYFFVTILLETIYNSLFAYLFFESFKKCALNYSLS